MTKKRKQTKTMSSAKQGKTLIQQKQTTKTETDDKDRNTRRRQKHKTKTSYSSSSSSFQHLRVDLGEPQSEVLTNFW